MIAKVANTLHSLGGRWLSSRSGVCPAPTGLSLSHCSPCGAGRRGVLTLAFRPWVASTPWLVRGIPMLRSGLSGVVMAPPCSPGDLAGGAS